MPENLAKIPYLYRSSGASLLIAKANKLTQLLGVDSPISAAKLKSSIRAGIAFYDMALILMKPYDPNYQTILNWRALALVKSGKYKEAVCSWKRIIELSVETEGGHSSNATAQLAKEKIIEFSQKDDEESDEVIGDESSLFDNPSFCVYAEDFCDLLAEGKFAKARSYLSPALRDELPVAALKSSLAAIVSGAEQDLIEIRLGEYLTDWPSRKVDDIGWCYFTMSSGSVSEGIAVVIAKNAHHSFEISSIEFGRP